MLDTDVKLRGRPHPRQLESSLASSLHLGTSALSLTRLRSYSQSISGEQKKKSRISRPRGGAAEVSGAPTSKRPQGGQPAPVESSLHLAHAW
jgi:hypothetical protein